MDSFGEIENAEPELQIIGKFDNFFIFKISLIIYKSNSQMIFFIF